jgi:hypothetical protein
MRGRNINRLKQLNFLVIKNLTIVERIKEYETKLEKEGFFGKEKYKEAYEKEVAEGKKPFTLVDLSQLTKYIENVEIPNEEEIEKKLKHRQQQWYRDEFKKWKKDCHANFGLLKNEKQHAVVEFCPQADRVRKVFNPCCCNEQKGVTLNFA